MRRGAASLHLTTKSLKASRTALPVFGIIRSFWEMPFNLDHLRIRVQNDQALRLETDRIPRTIPRAHQSHDLECWWNSRKRARGIFEGVASTRVIQKFDSAPTGLLSFWHWIPGTLRRASLNPALWVSLRRQSLSQCHSSLTKSPR